MKDDLAEVNTVLIYYNMSLLLGPKHSTTIVPPSKSSALLLNQSTARLINILVVKVVKEIEA
jgi:hypothetical protein